MQVTLSNITPNPEQFISFIARVSNPDNQNNPEYARLIRYLIKNKHWSPFEHAFMTLEIKTSRAIATQIIRHKSFSFQEYSQRYSEATTFEPIELREQAVKNRQSSTNVIEDEFLAGLVEKGISVMEGIYRVLLDAGVAKEVARMILPLTTQTTLYMTGSCRSWIHYIELRTDEHTQKEHRLIAEQAKQIFLKEFPFVSEAMGWNNE